MSRQVTSSQVTSSQVKSSQGAHLLSEHLVQKVKGEVERLWGRGEGAVLSTCMQGEVHRRFEGRAPGSSHLGLAASADELCERAHVRLGQPRCAQLMPHLRAQTERAHGPSVPVIGRRGGGTGGRGGRGGRRGDGSIGGGGGTGGDGSTGSRAQHTWNAASVAPTVAHAWMSALYVIRLGATLASCMLRPRGGTLEGAVMSSSSTTIMRRRQPRRCGGDGRRGRAGRSGAPQSPARPSTTLARRGRGSAPEGRGGSRPIQRRAWAHRLKRANAWSRWPARPHASMSVV
jgi:hypothetical protein